MKNRKTLIFRRSEDSYKSLCADSDKIARSILNVAIFWRTQHHLFVIVLQYSGCDILYVNLSLRLFQLQLYPFRCMSTSLRFGYSTCYSVFLYSEVTFTPCTIPVPWYLLTIDNLLTINIWVGIHTLVPIVCFPNICTTNVSFFIFFVGSLHLEWALSYTTPYLLQADR